MQKQAQNHAFIDSQNVNRAIRSLGWQLDWVRFRVYIKEKYSVTRAFLFTQRFFCMMIVLVNAGVSCKKFRLSEVKADFTLTNL